MKRVTGKTDPALAPKKVSIQLTLSGHSFSEDALARLDTARHAAEDATETEVCWLTEKTVLVPREAFAPRWEPEASVGENGPTRPPASEDGTDTPAIVLGSDHIAEKGDRIQIAASYLRVAGIVRTPDEEVVWSDPAADRIAIMAVRGDTLRALIRRTRGALHHTSPLLTEGAETADERSVHIRAEEDGLCFIQIYDEGLQFAEALRCDGEADLRYLMTRLGEAFPGLNRRTLRLTGSGATGVRRIVKRYFHRIICA